MRRTVILAVVVALAGCTGGVPATPAATTTTAPTTTTTVADDRTPVILDYSPTVSDVGALVFLASHPDVRLVGVTLPGTGESHCEQGVAHTRGILEELDLGGVPVACGPTRPFGRYNSFPIAWRTQSDGMDLPVAAPNETRTAPDLIADLVAGADRPVAIVAVGPLTNLAVAFTEHPGIAARVASITIMGGAVDVPGNVFRNTVGEWNIWVDPTAAGAVIAAGAPVTLVPLDATNHLPTGPIYYEALVSEPATPGSTLLGAVWAQRPDWIDNPEGWVHLWDELAALVLVDPTVATFEMRSLVVEDASFEVEGWTREHAAGTPVRVAVAADRLAVETALLTTILGREPALGYVTPTPGEIAHLDALARIAAEAEAGFDRVFTEASEGIDLEADEGAFLVVVQRALPGLFDGPIADQTAALRALAAPPGLREEHDAWVAALESLVAHRDDLAARIAAGDLEGAAAFLDPEAAACTAMEEAAARRLLDVDLSCA